MPPLSQMLWVACSIRLPAMSSRTRVVVSNWDAVNYIQVDDILLLPLPPDNNSYFLITLSYIALAQPSSRTFQPILLYCSTPLPPSGHFYTLHSARLTLASSPPAMKSVLVTCGSCWFWCRFSLWVSLIASNKRLKSSVKICGVPATAYD